VVLAKAVDFYTRIWFPPKTWCWWTACCTSSILEVHILTHTRHHYNRYNFTALSLSLHFNGQFPGEPGLAGVYWSKGWWKRWWQLEL